MQACQNRCNRTDDILKHSPPNQQILTVARQESDKEDLIRDATALVERAELICDGSPTLVTIGFFRDGRCTVYFEQDPFYQFDSEGRVRRAYENGFLYRSQASTLARMDRHRPTNADGETEKVILQRFDLTEIELIDFRERMLGLIRSLRDSIQNRQYTVQRAVTPDGNIPAQTLTLLKMVTQQKADFIAPPAAPR